MNYKNVKILVITAISFVVVSTTVLQAQSQFQLQDTARMNPAARVHYERKLESRAFDYYTNGLLSDQLGDYYHAARSYQAALKFFPESVEIGYSLANAYLNLREPELALEVANNVKPVNSDVLSVMASAYRMLEDVESYRATYIRMAQINPESYQAFATLSELYLRMRVLDSAQWALEGLSQITPANYQVWNRLGRVSLSLEEHDKALEAFDKSFELNNTIENLNGLLGRADVFEGMNQHDSAIIALKEALQLAGPNPMLLSRMAVCLTSLNRFDEAIIYVRQLVAQVPEDLDQQRRLGMIYYYADSLDQAEAVLNALILQNDVNDLNHYFLGLIYSAQEKSQEAKEQFTIVTGLAGTVADSWINLGLAYRTLGHTDSALTAYRHGLVKVATAEDSVRLLYISGATQEEMGLVDEAISSFEWILAIDPDFHQALNYLGYLLADRNLRLEYALKLLTKAIEMRPENSAYIDSYGWIFYRMGDYKTALIHLKRAAELDSDPVMFDHLGDAYSANGDRDKARVWWQNALDLDPDNEAIKEKLND